MRQSMWCDIGICGNSHGQDNPPVQCIHTYANDRSRAMGGSQPRSRRSGTPGVSSWPKGAGMLCIPYPRQFQLRIRARVGPRHVGSCRGGCSYRQIRSGRFRWRPSLIGGDGRVKQTESRCTGWCTENEDLSSGAFICDI